MKAFFDMIIFRFGCSEI